MIELFKEAFSEILSEKKVDWVRKSGQNARMSQVLSPDLKQSYCVAIDIFSSKGVFPKKNNGMTHHFKVQYVMTHHSYEFNG